LNYASLNHPDLNRALIERWVAICENVNDDKKVAELYKNLDNFCTAILEKVRNLRFEEVDGVRIFVR
jgi:hypothetical protein